MTKRERVTAAIEGRPVDRVPVSFWRHFPDVDEDADRLAETMAAFQREYDLDLVKLMPNGMYGTEDFGCRIGNPDPRSGAKRLIEGPVRTADDWLRLSVPPPDRGARGRELRCLGLVRRALGPDVPILQTVFSPLTTAAKIASPARLAAMLQTHPAQVHQALETITRAEEAFVAACAAAGADGIFFATQLAQKDGAGEETYRTFGRPYDLRVLGALRRAEHTSIVHIHGTGILFSLFLDYPAPVLNWHDRLTPPSITEARTQRARGAFAGGLDEQGILLTGSPAAVADDVRRTLRQTGGYRHILTPGCVVPQAVPGGNLRAAREAANGFVPGERA